MSTEHCVIRTTSTLSPGRAHYATCGEWAPMNAIHRLVGMGGDQLLPELLGHDNPEVRAERPRRYQELTGDVLAFPRAAEALREVHARGLVVVLATSAPDDELVTLRKALRCRRRH